MYHPISAKWSKGVLVKWHSVGLPPWSTYSEWEFHTTQHIFSITIIHTQDFQQSSANLYCFPHHTFHSLLYRWMSWSLAFEVHQNDCRYVVTIGRDLHSSRHTRILQGGQLHREAHKTTELANLGSEWFHGNGHMLGAIRYYLNTIATSNRIYNFLSVHWKMLM